ncbi:hypothetical protein BIY21_20520 [Vibrio ponticus]|uniref:HTH marR-type domain-containing protein n=1 Tax=Vibrio ponticus TaxID=265668 RepID=A0ABX3FNH8_9VIBR|nr:MarR family transcriptional regulator [Vibrio ponticus]OLQ95810.1 hypothetical protein BIY21_20520 [Vibrio ponticus]
MNKFLEIIDTFSEMQDVENVYDKKARTYGDVEGTYTPSEAFLVKYIYENDRISVTNISKKMYKSKSAISQMLKRIGDKGLIVINKNSIDARYMDITLTELGIELYFARQKVNDNYSEQLEKYLEPLSSEELDTVMKFLDLYMKFRKDTSLGKN